MGGGAARILLRTFRGYWKVLEHNSLEWYDIAPLASKARGTGSKFRLAAMGVRLLDSI